MAVVKTRTPQEEQGWCYLICIFSWKKLPKLSFLNTYIITTYVLRLQNDKITDLSFKHSLKLLDKYSISHFLFDLEAIFGYLGLGTADSGTKEWMEKLGKKLYSSGIDFWCIDKISLVIKKSCSGVSNPASHSME